MNILQESIGLTFGFAIHRSSYYLCELPNSW